jgi:SAM-dependent methyltransferase
MQTNEYALQNRWGSAERRLRGIEATYDPVTRRRLTALGVGPGWTCLEVGAGAGSVARWLADQVGRDGTVVAADLDSSRLGDMPTNVEVRELDVRVDRLPGGEFDLIHARLFLNHIAEREQVLDKLVAALRHGGWLLLEEGDAFTPFVPGDRDEEPDHARAMRAWCDALAATGANVYLGRELPRLMQARGIRDIDVECQVPVTEGGTLETEWLGLTYDQLNEGADGELLDTETYTRWKEAIGQRGRWFASLPLVAASGRRDR